MKILMFLVLSVFSTIVASESYKVVYHLNESEKASVLISSVNQLHQSGSVSEIVVIVHGSAITRLSKRDSLSASFENLIQAGVKIGACSISMLKRKMKHDLILDGVSFVKEGGVLRILKLQKQGYDYIKI